MVEDDVENDLEARSVERLDHVAKLVDGAERIPRCAVALVGRKERHGRIAPVVHQAWRGVVRVELEHRQELHRGDAQSLEIRNLFDEAGERAARLLGQPGTRMPGEAAHVHLVHDGLRRRSPERGVAFPVV
jgi:hypothetical protein